MYTYEDLAKDIRGMTPEQQQQAVRYLEPYDDDPAAIEASHLVFSDSDIMGEDGVVLIKKNEVYLE